SNAGLCRGTECPEFVFKVSEFPTSDANSSDPAQDSQALDTKAAFEETRGGFFACAPQTTSLRNQNCDQSLLIKFRYERCGGPYGALTRMRSAVGVRYGGLAVPRCRCRGCDVLRRSIRSLGLLTGGPRNHDCRNCVHARRLHRCCAGVHILRYAHNWSTC